MQDQLNQAIKDLFQAHADFNKGALKSVPHADMREAAIAKALRAMVAICGTELSDLSYYINSLGEYALTTPKDASNFFHKCGFGERFASWINQHRPRTGVQYTAKMDKDSTWCNVNHFEVEKMVVAFHKDLQKTLQNA